MNAEGNSLANMFFLLGHIWRASKKYFVTNILLSALRVTRDFTGLVFIKILVDIIQNLGKSFPYYIHMVVIVEVIECITVFIIEWVDEKVIPSEAIVVARYFHILIFDRNTQLDIACFERTEFLNDCIKAQNEAENRACSLMTLVSQLVYSILMLASCVVWITTLDCWFVLLIIAQVLIGLTKLSSQNKEYYEEYSDIIRISRSINYIKNLFFNCISFIKDAKVYRIDSLMKAMYNDKISEMYSSVCKHRVKRMKIALLTDILSHTISTVILLLIVYRTLNGILLVSDFIVTNGLILNIIQAAARMFNTIPQIKQNGRFISNFKTLLEYESVIQKKEISPICGATFNNNFPILNLQNLRFRYENSEEIVLNNITMKVTEGDKIAIIGENGSGKTTLLKLIAMFYLADRGQILYKGVEYASIGPGRIQSNISIMSQDYTVYAISVAENVLMRRMRGKEDEIKVLEALEAVELRDKIEKLPQGIHSIMSRQFCEEGTYLSQGQLQKLCLARVFANESEILLLDEMTSSIDKASTNRIIERLLSTNKTIIFVTHDDELAEKADKVFSMDRNAFLE